MHKTTIYVALLALLVTSAADSKRTRRKRPKAEDDSTPQPNVVTYSTFGFNDVGAYDGFVPSSPDYASYLSNYNQESGTRLYAPAFPTAMDSPSFNNYGSTSQDSPYPASDDNVPQASMMQYPQSTVSFYNTPSLDSNDPRSHVGTVNEMFSPHTGDGSPIYGTKLGSRGRNKPISPYNDTDFSIFNSELSPTSVKYSTIHEVHSNYDSKPGPFGDQNKNIHNQNKYESSFPSDTEDSITSTQSPLNFPKVIDFTKYKQYYPAEMENKFTTTSTSKPLTTSYNPWPNPRPNENSYTNNFEDFRTKFPNPSNDEPYRNKFNDPYKNKYNDENDKTTPKSVTYTSIDFSHNYFNNPNEKDVKDSKYDFEYKDKVKQKPWTSTNYTNDYKNWKNPLKGYQYSTDASNMTFEFDFSGVKKPSSDNHDEVPASSNIVDLTSYTFPEPDHSSSKKPYGRKPPFGDLKAYREEFEKSIQSFKQNNKFDPEEINSYKQNSYDPEEYVRSLYTTIPTTTTHWGNVYKTSDFNPFKTHPKKPHFVDEISDDVVHIPKRPYGNKYSFGKYSESKPTDWPSINRPYKSKKNKESTRFKSEEDLLGLRTHDTSHPTYLPTYRPGSSNTISDEYDYKKLVEKWRQSYLKAKYKDYAHDFESYPSESKPIHVPVPKPYPIEVPHPVIVPVPQPYPVRVPVPKPVAVPFIRELTVPIEKPVPYPVIKKVPYPVEKPVPVKVEKEVQVPIVKPYPVPVPHVRPVFHHTRPRDEVDHGIDADDEDDYLPRPEKRIPYAKRIKSTRTRSRRPSRVHQYHHERSPYQDRNRRRWPSQKSFPDPKYPSFALNYKPQPFKRRDTEEPPQGTDFQNICKRIGTC